ncbi:alanyl-tRNA editing protein [Deinococcus arenicola]|uniref:Alanine--tRNA ligase-related protein n=1 Tax=Deinococcus arenicola TaxID=2994950 RepID=A0ABU4DSY4_9DEIO|nr:alanine--tRNA ligase-related protein [Deinococcus sp. ZS9-10]MDV6375543.1 alanine--tRNA ligase-related protein [Deinococcus sp. ZS9-10]
MTRALYHEDSTQLTFSASVQAVNGSEVALDATAFYPAGGGQSADHGVWGWSEEETRVTDTRKDKATDIIWHKLEGTLPAVGTQIAGEVDAARRWRHMARHSGEHLLAQAFVRIDLAFAVDAVNMTHPECTLDLRGDPTEADVRAAETLLRETLVRQTLTLDTPIVLKDELENYPLRRETKIRGQVRLVIFRDRNGQPFDVSACGGTHVPNASLAAPVVVLRTERIRGGVTRVVFMAGEEASRYLGIVYRDARALAQGFSVPVERLTERVEALRSDLAEAKAEAAKLREALARSLVVPIPPDAGGVRFVQVDDAALLLPVLTDIPAGEVRVALAKGGRCGIASGRQDIHAGEVLRAALAITGGKGGGRPELAQGSTLKPDDFLTVVQNILTSTQSS